MSPLPFPKHQRIAAALTSEFHSALKRCDKCLVYQHFKVADDIVLQPDMLVVCKLIEKKFLDFSPDLVVEILSPSTALKDRHKKFEIYEQQKIKYYIIISPESEGIEILEYIKEAYQLKESGKGFMYNFILSAPCEVNINFNEVW
jgi:Uma2 family endonuclease